MDDDKIIIELKRLNNYLAILSVGPTENILSALKEKKILNTKQRVQMFLLIDGERTTPEIAKESQAGLRGAQLFIKELQKKGYARIERAGRAIIPKINYYKIIELISENKQEKGNDKR